MVKIRLRRVGAKKQPSYRVVVADSRSPRDGRFIEVIGFYNPRTEPETVSIEEERALYWLSVGAQPTESAARLLRTHGTMARFERLKQGEPLETLVAEAEEAARAAEEVSPKTRREPTAPVAEEPAVEPEVIEPEAEPSEAGDEAEKGEETELAAAGDEGEDEEAEELAVEPEVIEPETEPSEAGDEAEEGEETEPAEAGDEGEEEETEEK
jgi:small subunit ribosomal protein S16